MFYAVPNRFKCRQNAYFRDIAFNIFSAVPNRFKYRQHACVRDITPVIRHFAFLFIIFHRAPVTQWPYNFQIAKLRQWYTSYTQMCKSYTHIELFVFNSYPYS